MLAVSTQSSLLSLRPQRGLQPENSGTCICGVRGRLFVQQAEKESPCMAKGIFSKSGDAGSRVREKLCFKKSSMVDIGPFKVSPMGLGTWAWGNQFLWDYSPDKDSELQELFNYAVSQGINLFDTADSYGTGLLNGRSEKLLGQFIKEYPGSKNSRDRIRIATKFAAYPWRIFPARIVAACKGSLSRLNTTDLALGQLHWSASNYAPLQEVALWNGLADCYEQGLVEAVGVSNYGPKEIGAIHKKLERRNVPLHSAQVQFSLLSYGNQQKDLLEMCKELDVTVISYSPLTLGLLSGKFNADSVPRGPRGALFRQLLPKIRPVLGTLKAISRERNKSMSQVAINWCMRKGTVPIPGARDMSQVKDNLSSLGWTLRNPEIAELDASVEKSSGKMIQNIFQTKICNLLVKENITKTTGWKCIHILRQI